MLSHDPAFGFHLCNLSYIFLLCFLCLLWLFGKPTISVKQLNTDSSVAVDVVNP